MKAATCVKRQGLNRESEWKVDGLTDCRNRRQLGLDDRIVGLLGKPAILSSPPNPLPHHPNQPGV
jgi:hypothetical protein